MEDRIQVVNWTNDDEVIAEGYLISTDPKEMVNNITLGPNAAIVKIVNVINKEAYLWRPSESMNVMGDALCRNIAWPFSKVQLFKEAVPSVSKGTVPLVSKGAVPSKDSSSKASSPKVKLYS